MAKLRQVKAGKMLKIPRSTNRSFREFPSGINREKIGSVTTTKQPQTLPILVRWDEEAI